jgi:hypothetical protein
MRQLGSMRQLHFGGILVALLAASPAFAQQHRVGATGPQTPPLLTREEALQALKKAQTCGYRCFCA